MSTFTKKLEKHLTHSVTTIFTPGKIHYAKLCCVDCNNLFLQWLSADNLVTIGQITEEQKQELIKSKRPKVQQLQNQGKYKTKSSWTTITTQERTFYKSYQPPKLPRTPTQLIGDRLALNSYSKYNGNSIHSIPLKYLEQLIVENKITRREDRQRIMDSIKIRSGADLSPPSK